ncbi:centrosome-associated protein 350-like [Heptranchias perlo]|uniref:centrosome-associated protein 350-like n=1 Tax=Heptranchias perlo TaxID=212740 RepID=UPI00355A3AA5
MMENSNRLDEVDLAWDNLQEAKSVLQQIENKLNFEEDDILPEQSIGKHLQSEAFGGSVKGTGSISKQGGSPQRPTALRRWGLDKHGAPCPKWTLSSSRTNDSRKFNYVLENCYSSRRMLWNERSSPLYNDVIDQDIPLSGVNQTTVILNQDLNGNLSTGVIPTRSQTLVDMDMVESDRYVVSKPGSCSGSSQSNKCHLEGSPPAGNGSNLTLDYSVKRRIVQEKKHSPEPSVAASSPVRPGSPFAQKLQLLRSKSPTNKLERLKEQIRKQRQLQKEQRLEWTSLNLPQEQPIPVLWQKIGDSFKDGPMKHMVRKVTFAPPAPAYKGFNAVELKSDKKGSGVVAEKEEPFTVNIRTSRQELVRHRDWGLRDAEQRRNSLKNSGRNHEATHKSRSSSKSPSLKTTAKVEGPHTSGVFAWREGQKLVRMLLGPPPKLPKSPAETLDPNDRNGLDLSDQQVKDPRSIPVEHERSTSLETSPGRRLYILNDGGHFCTSLKTGLLDPGQSGFQGLRAAEISGGLQSEKNTGKNQNSTWRMTNGSPSLERESGEDSQRGLASSKGQKYLLRHKDERGGPSPGSSSSPRKYIPKSGSHPSRKRSLSPPKCRARSSSPFPNNPGEENQEGGGAGTEEQPPSPRARSYNADEVREYMNRQLAVRRKKEREEKQSVKQAMEVKKKRLQEVYRKQKEAFSQRKRGKQKNTLLPQQFVHHEEESARKENRVSAAQVIKDRAPAQGRTEPGDLEESGSCQQELSYVVGPFHRYLHGQRSPLRLKDLEPHHHSPEWSSPLRSLSPPVDQFLPLPLANCERETGCKATFNGCSGYRSKQQRIQALRSMATALSGRIEDEVKRLGVEAEILKSPGNQGRNDGWTQVDLGGFAPPDPAAKLNDSCGPEWQRFPGIGLATTPRGPTDFKISPTALQKGADQQEAETTKDKGVESKTELEVKELMDELLCSSSPPSEDFLWSDSEPLAEHELHSKPGEPSDTLPDEQKELANKCAGVQRSFGKGNHQAAREIRTHELPFRAARSENRSLGGRGSQQTSRVQDGNKSSLAQKSKRLGSRWSPSRTNATSPSGANQTDNGKDSGYQHGIRRCQPIASDSLETREGASPTGKSQWKTRQSHDSHIQCSAIADHSYNHESAEFPRSPGLCPAQNGRPLDRSRPSTNTRNIPTKELAKGKEDPVTQRLAELMKELQEETEQLRFRSRTHSSLKEDSSTELKRSSMISPVITETTKNLRRNTGRRASVEISVDGKESVSGTTHVSLGDGSLVKDTLVEQSFWSLLPSESHWRRTMESNKKLQLGDNSVQNTTNEPFRKWQEVGMPIFGSQDALSRFTLEMAQQYLKEEELRARHQTALFRLREKALREKTKAELAWLEHQKTHLRDKGQDDKMPAIIKKQREILMKLQQEKVEIRHLQNVYRAAHQERKLLLKQQQEIFRIHQSTAQLQCQLDGSATGPLVSAMKDTSPDAAAVNQSGSSPTPDPSPRPPDQGVRSSSPLSTSGSEASVAMGQLKKMNSRLDERFLTKKEKELIRRRRQAEDLLEWKQRLDAEELAVHRIETEAVAAWSPQAPEKVPGARDPLTERDNWNDEKSSESPESNEPLVTEEVVTSAEDDPLDDQSQRQQNVKLSAENLEQMPTILEPSQKSATDTEVAEIQSDKGLLITETAPEPTAGETYASPRRRELANRKAMMGNMRSEQKKRQREMLKMEESELCRQLEAYDAFIRRTQADLISDSDFNRILKPQIKTPSAAQHKPRGVFPSPQRSDILKHSAKPSFELLQSQESPSKRGEKAKDMGKVLKTQEITGSVDVRYPPGKSEIDDKPSTGPASQLPPPSGPVDWIQSAENQSETLTVCESLESSGSSDIVIEPSDSSSGCKEEIPRYSKSDGSACNGTKSNGLSDDTLSKKPSIVLETEQNVIIPPSKLTESLFGRRPQLHLNNDWNDFSTKATNNSSQTSAQHFLNNNTNLKAEQSIELENIQPSTIVKNEENWLELPDRSENISGFRPSSNHQPPLELARNEILAPAREVDCQEMTAGRKDDNFPEPTATPPSPRSSPFLDGNAAFARGQWTLASCSRTAEAISPIIPLSYIDDFSSAEENSEGQDQVSLSNEAMQSSAKRILCAKEKLPPSPDQAISSRSKTVEEMALYRVDKARVAEDMASKSDELPPLKEKEKSCSRHILSPVLKASVFKEEDLAISVKGIGSSAQQEQPSLVEEISSISEELLSPVEEDSMFNIKELMSPVDELMFYGSETFPHPAEDDISFETEDFPPPPEEMILCRNEELPSPYEENAFIRIDDLPPPSVDHSLINEELPSLGDKHNLLNTDDFTPPPPPIEEIGEDRKNVVTEKCKHPLRTGGEEETSTQFGGEDLFLPESSRIHIPRAEQQMADPLRGFNIGDRVLVSYREPGTLRFKGLTSFGQDYWAGVELDKPNGDNDGTFCAVKYFECTDKCGIFVTPDQISHLCADFEVDTDVADSEDSFSDGPSLRNYKNLEDELKEADFFEEESEEKANEKGTISQLRVKKPTSHQLNQREPYSGSDDDAELERIILECAKAVESFVGSQDLLDAEAEPKLHLFARVNSEGLVCTRTLKCPQGTDSEQSVNDVTEHLTEHLVEETLGEPTSIREQQNQSTRETGVKRLDGHQITQDCSKLTKQIRGPLKRQRGHDTSFIDVINLLRIDCIQLKDQIRIVKGGCSQEAIENVTASLIAKFIDDAAKEYTQIKRKHNRNLEARDILCPQTAVDCLTLDGVLNAGNFVSSQDINEKFAKPQPFQGIKTRGQMFVLDQWCSGPWKQSKETIFVVPHNLLDVQQLVEGAVNDLWNQRGQQQGGGEINVFEALKDTDTDEIDEDAESKRVYKQAIFDLTSDIFQNLLMKDPKAICYPWMKHKPWAGLSSGRSPNTEVKGEVKSFIQGKVAKLLNLDRNDLEIRRKLQKLTKYDKSKRDRVDIILIQELQEEESQWVEYADDELAVKTKLTEDIFNILVHDTVDVLNTICDKRSAGQGLTSSSTRPLKAPYYLQN